jgi:hypothetical protein
MEEKEEEIMDENDNELFEQKSSISSLFCDSVV